MCRYQKRPQTCLTDTYTRNYVIFCPTSSMSRLNASKLVIFMDCVISLYCHPESIFPKFAAVAIGMHGIQLIKKVKAFCAYKSFDSHNQPISLCESKLF